MLFFLLSNVFDNFNNEKFDVIINDISGISVLNDANTSSELMGIIGIMVVKITTIGTKHSMV